jgi:hypothetical protein
MGEVIVSAKIENLEDHFEVKQGRIEAERTRSVPSMTRSSILKSWAC